MDENKNFIEGEKVEEANTNTSNETNTANATGTKTSYRPVSEFTVKSKKEKKSGFGRTIAVPFISGVVGGALVIGTCFGVPSIKKAIIGSNANSSNNSNNFSNTYTGINTDLVSLKEYSETGVGVAAKILPSVVGITVEFPVNSIFSRGTSTTTGEGSGIIISEDGYILTNNHIVSSSSSSSYYTVGDASKEIHLECKVVFLLEL